jgi:hypothetical protein
VFQRLADLSSRGCFRLRIPVLQKRQSNAGIQGRSVFHFLMASAPKELPGDLLKATSRLFYLTLRVLPAAVRPQTGLAPRLARSEFAFEPAGI